MNKLVLFKRIQYLKNIIRHNIQKLKLEKESILHRMNYCNLTFMVFYNLIQFFKEEKKFVKILMETELY